MIDIIAIAKNEVVTIRIERKKVFFRNSIYGDQFFPINQLKYEKYKVIERFPDLKDDPKWEIKAKQRFEKYFKRFKNEQEMSEYFINELIRIGYIPLYRIKNGIKEKIQK